jgi:hypothetical protein
MPWYGFKEEWRRIRLAAPHLPRQTFFSVVILVLIPVLSSIAISNYNTDWIKAQAKPISYSEVREEHTGKKTVFTFTTNYIFQIGGTVYSLERESEYSSASLANYHLEQTQKYHLPLTVWYDPDDPTRYAFEISDTFWQPYVFLVGILILLLVLFRYLYHKYYDLEIFHISDFPNKDIIQYE